MNQQQRKFLIEKIEATAKIHIDALKDSIPDPPSLENFLFHAVMSGKFEIVDNKKIRALIKEKALQSKSGNAWMNGRSAFTSSNGREITFDARSFFVMPKEYEKLRNDYEKKRDEANKKISDIAVQRDTLVTRITLASDKTLQTLINEVDDMGNLSLMDTKLKLLSA